MKKLLLLAVFLLSTAALSNAQKINDAPPQSTTEQQFHNLKYVDLLNRQNDLLNDRVIAISLSLGGGFLTGLTASLINGGSADTFTATLYIFSLATTLVGSVWLTVNEFQLISNRKKINDNLTLRYGPDGVALQF